MATQSLAPNFVVLTARVALGQEVNVRQKVLQVVGDPTQMVRQMLPPISEMCSTVWASMIRRLWL